MNKKKKFTWDLYEITRDDESWISRHFDKTYYEMLTIIADEIQIEDLEIMQDLCFNDLFWILNTKNDEYYKLQIFQ